MESEKYAYAPILKFAFAVVLTTALVLGLHVALLSMIPRSDPYFIVKGSQIGVAMGLNSFCVVLSILFVYRCCSQSFARWSLVSRCFIFFLLLAMNSQALLRAPLMNLVGWSALYSCLISAPSLLSCLFLSALCVGTAHWFPQKVSKGWFLCLAAAVFTAALKLVWDPSATSAVHHLLARVPAPALYSPKKIPIAMTYITFVEPVLASFILVSLAWENLAMSIAGKMAEWSVLLFAMSGLLFLPFVSFGFVEFGVELIALAALTVASIHLLGCPPRRTVVPAHGLEPRTY